jgi:hypothetical protein
MGASCALHVVLLEGKEPLESRYTNLGLLALHLFDEKNTNVSVGQSIQWSRSGGLLGPRTAQ